MADVKPDWERIESDYRAGILSVREIAASQGITHGAINKRAKRDGWVRDLTAKIRAKADQLVSTSLVSTQVSTEKAATERAIIDANAERIAQVRGEHRKDITRARTLATDMLVELEVQTGANDLFERLGELLDAPDDHGIDKLNELYRKVIGLPSRVDSVKKLADTLKTLIALEREAYNIAGDDRPAGTKFTRIELVALTEDD